MGYGVYLKGVPIEAVPLMRDADLGSAALKEQVRKFDATRGAVTPLLDQPAPRASSQTPHPALRTHLIDSLVLHHETGGGALARTEGESLLVDELDLALAEVAALAYQEGDSGPEAAAARTPATSTGWLPEPVALVARPTPSWLRLVIANRLGIEPDVTPQAPAGGPPMPAAVSEPFSYVRDTSNAMVGADPIAAIQYGEPRRKPTLKRLLDSGETILGIHEELGTADPEPEKSLPSDGRVLDALIGKLTGSPGEEPEWNPSRLERDVVDLYARGVAPQPAPAQGDRTVSILSSETAELFLTRNDVMVRYEWKRMPRGAN